MKRILFLLLMMTCSISWAEWEFVGENNAFFSFVDKSTIQTNGNIAKMWSMKDFALIRKDAVGKYRSVKVLSVYDCKEETSATVAVIFFEGARGSGNIVFRHTFHKGEWDWEPISPDSTGKAYWKIACGKK